MGGMVAGVAHELNTPIGNTITAVSTQIDRIGKLQSALTTGTLSKSGLANDLEEIREIALLIERNVHRAAAQVDNFKQLALDHISDEKRTFELREIVDECLKSLRPGLRSGSWNISNNIPGGLVCDGLPGSIGQVVTIMVQNAIEHGYKGLNSGDIELRAQRQDKRIELAIADKGAGMEHSIQQRIFEPFFTTTFGQGRSGLGLAIAYRVITTVLAGEVRVDSQTGSGTTFSVRFPA
jgi:signal transduction histidine kinase